MSLFDWVQMGFTGRDQATGGDDPIAKKFDDIFKGSFSVTLGDALLSFVLGGRHTHVYGDEFKFVFDWEALVEGLIGRFVPGVFGVGGALLFGAGGDTNMTIGRRTSLIYGVSTDVRRAVTATATGKNYLWNWFTGNAGFMAPSAPAGSVDQPRQDYVDKICGAIGGVLAALMVMSSAALELLAAFKYRLGDPAGPAKMQTLIRTLSWTISARLGALIIKIEAIEHGLRDAVAKTAILRQLVQDAPNWRVWRLTIADFRLRAEFGRQDAVDGLSEYEWAIAKIVALTVLVVAAIAAAVGTMATGH